MAATFMGACGWPSAIDRSKLDSSVWLRVKSAVMPKGWTRTIVEPTTSESLYAQLNIGRASNISITTPLPNVATSRRPGRPSFMSDRPRIVFTQPEELAW